MVDNYRAFTVYVQNLPVQWDALDLYKEMSKSRNVVDIFIPRKPRWNGVRYGFVRFENSGKIGDVVEKINSGLEGGHTIRANIARARWNKEYGGSREKGVEGRNKFGGGGSRVRHNFSFKQAVEMDEGEGILMKEDKSLEKEGASVVFNPNKKCLDRMKNCSFGAINEGMEFSLVSEQLARMFGSSISIKSLGGNHALLVFESRDETLACVKSVQQWNNDCFEMRKAWEDGDASRRTCWLNIYGVPPHAWCEKFFSLLAISFGKFLKLLNTLNNSDDLEVAKIQILMSYRLLGLEEGESQADLEKVVTDMVIREVEEWVKAQAELQGGLSMVWDVFYLSGRIDSIRLLLGDGMKCKSWLDRWLNEKPAKEAYSRLYSCTCIQIGVVEEAVHCINGRWAMMIYWRRRLFYWVGSEVDVSMLYCRIPAFVKVERIDSIGVGIKTELLLLKMVWRKPYVLCASVEIDILE
ncbi:hypothetical protein Tsubulata_030258 [Turnera subulata]|uniref:RRM domain-containing protein n=1 Tax=Turnera subulata TaxID=218843 RepID=A0A9Q0F792_9ROSI|nr:hypothetical protein Tsubulata_030258 [Turnera subulata]